MLFRRTPGALVFLALVAGCDAGISESAGGRITAFTLSFPTGDGCAVHSDGSVLCRGANDYGRLGIGTAAEGAFDPVNLREVDASFQARAVSVAWAHACALDGDGAAWCWGSNRSGQLGIGDSTGPEQCAVTLSYYPVVEIGTIPCATRPVRVMTNVRFRSISADDNESCGLTAGGELWCWGEGDDGFGLGAAGLPTSCSHGFCAVPVRAAPGLLFSAVTRAWSGTCGIGPERVLYCWGQDYTGRFGRELGSMEHSFAPVPINSTAAIRDVATAEDHTCAVTTSGALMCFGSNSSGQLGDGTTISRTTPKQTFPPTPFAKVAVSLNRSCALDSAGKAWCWGYNTGGGLGIGTFLPALSPEPVLGDLTFERISVGGAVCGTTNHDIWCWGQLPTKFEE